MVICVGDVDIAILVERDPCRRAELPVVHTFPAYADGQQIGRGHPHDLLRLETLPLLRHYGNDIVVTNPVGQVVMDKRTLGAFQTGALIFFHPNDGFKIIGGGNRTREIGELDHHALGGLEIEIVVHGIGNGIPGNGDPAIPRFRGHVCRRRGKFFFSGNRIAGPPFSLGSFDGQMRSIRREHLAE